MLDLSPEKILVLGVLALVVLGPDRLPGTARTLGRALGHLRSMSASLQSEVRDALREPSEAFESVFAEGRSMTSALVPSERPVRSETRVPSETRASSSEPDDPALN